MRFWTYTLNAGSININATDGAMFLSILSSTLGGCTVLGNIPFKGVPPAPVSVATGNGMNLSALSPQSPIDGITITWVSGSIDVLIGF